MTRKPAYHQAERFRPARIDEDPQKNQSRFGSLEETPPDTPADLPELEDDTPWSFPLPDLTDSGSFDFYDSEPYSDRPDAGAYDIAAEAPDREADEIAPGPRRQFSGGDVRRSGRNTGPAAPASPGPAQRDRRGGGARNVRRGSDRIPRRAARLDGVRTAASLAVSAAVPEDRKGNRERQGTLWRLQRFRIARRGARTTRSGIQTTGRAAVHLGRAVSSALKEAGMKGVLKVLAVKLGLPLLLILVLLLLVVVVFISIFSVKSQPSDLNDAYLYITRLDAEAERDILAAMRTGLETTYFVNGEETSVEDIRVQTDADHLLLYLDTVYETAALAAPISGFFGGRTVQAEIDAIHSRLCSYAVSIIEEEVEGPDGETSTVARQEVHVSLRSSRALLEAAGALDDGQREIMSTMAQIGAWSALEALSSPFPDAYYADDRWGWYADGSGRLQQRDGVVLIPLSGNSVSSCAAGTVTQTGAGSVSVALTGGGTIQYGQLRSVAVTVGQTLEKGEQIGTISPGQGLYLEYTRNGMAVNPVFYLPWTGAAGSNTGLVAVALSQLGNVGGQPYWSWMGFPSRVEWCACFVSWCANECGYIDSGALPKTAGVVTGARWFKDRGLWQDRSYEPRPGDIIYFDWDNRGASGPQNNFPDHVGIVERTEEGIVYTIEGNSGDSCRRRSYPVGHYEIWGYGTPIF